MIRWKRGHLVEEKELDYRNLFSIFVASAKLIQTVVRQQAPVQVEGCTHVIVEVGRLIKEACTLMIWRRILENLSNDILEFSFFGMQTYAVLIV